MSDQERQPVQITTRIPADMADRIQAIADAERRSLSNLLMIAVEQFLTSYEKNLSQGG